MVDHADFLVAVYDNERNLRSGTMQTVHYAEKKGLAITLIPVSYTHLDVYKRQAIMLRILNCQRIWKRDWRLWA